METGTSSQLDRYAHLAPTSCIPASLEDLSADHKRLINDQLSRKQSSTDAECAEYLVEEGLTREQAHLVVGFRSQAMFNLSYELFPDFYYCQNRRPRSGGAYFLQCLISTVSLIKDKHHRP